MKLVRLIEPSKGLEVGKIYNANVSCNMCHIIIDEKHSWINRNKFELITKLITERRVKKCVLSDKYVAKHNHNEETKLTAKNNRKRWKDKELEEIFLEYINYTQFPNKEIDEFCEKFKRTYFAIEAIVRVKDVYLKTKKLRDFYYDYKKDGLTVTGEQMKRVLDKLIREKKI